MQYLLLYFEQLLLFLKKNLMINSLPLAANLHWILVNWRTITEIKWQIYIKGFARTFSKKLFIFNCCCLFLIHLTIFPFVVIA